MYDVSFKCSHMCLYGDCRIEWKPTVAFDYADCYSALNEELFSENAAVCSCILWVDWRV